MKTCPKCNISGIPDEASFCPKCGQPIISTPNPWEENRQNQLQKANAGLIEMKSKLIAFESERRRFFSELMQSDSYISDIQVNTSIIRENWKKELNHQRIENKGIIVGIVDVIIILACAVICSYYTEYKPLNIVGLNFWVMLKIYAHSPYLLGAWILIAITGLIIDRIFLTKLKSTPLIGNKTTLEIQGFYEKHKELYSYMRINLEAEIINAENVSNEIFDKINDIDNKLRKNE